MRMQTDCMICSCDQMQRSTARCPCCNERLNYAYCEDCGAMFLEHVDSDKTTMLESDEE